MKRFLRQLRRELRRSFTSDEIRQYLDGHHDEIAKLIAVAEEDRRQGRVVSHTEVRRRHG